MADWPSWHRSTDTAAVATHGELGREP